MTTTKKTETAAVTTTRDDGDQTRALAMIAELATNPDCDPGKLREILQVRREWEKDEARKAFAAAIADFQRDAPIIKPGDDAHGRPYAKMDRIWREIRPLMDACGLSVTWQSCKVVDGECLMVGSLWHRGGHAEPIEYALPMPDAIKGQNAAQVMGSATTYAKRYGTCMVLGIQVGTDDDGRHAARGDVITAEQAENIAALLKESGTSAGRLLAWAQCDAVTSLPADKYDRAVRKLKRTIAEKQGDGEPEWDGEAVQEELPT